MNESDQDNNNEPSKDFICLINAIAIAGFILAILLGIFSDSPSVWP